MVKYYYSIRRFAVILLLIFSAQSAFALLTIKNPTVTDLGGKSVDGAILQLLTGGSADTPSPAKSPYYSGNLFANQFANTDSTGVSSATIPISQSGLTVILKAWNGTPGKDSYYGFKPGSSGGTKDTFRWDPASIQTEYKAAPPYKPRISRFEETSTTYADGSKTASLKVVADPGSVTDGKREGSTYTWQMGVLGGQLSTVTGQTGSTLSLSSDKVVTGTTYTFKVCCSGPWGDSDWESKDHAVSGSSGTPSFNFNLKPASETKLIVNCISVSSTSNYTKASELANFINTAANAKIVAAIYKFDTANAAPVPALFDTATGAFVSGTDFLLTPGEGIQVYTTQELLNVNL